MRETQIYINNYLKTEKITLSQGSVVSQPGGLGSLLSLLRGGAVKISLI